jgi:predicted nucleic acid-binding protein
MAYAYFDTTALIKRYVEELGRREVLTLLRKNQCVVSAVLPVEVRSALRRRVAEKTLDAKRVPGILKRLAADRAYWTIIEVSREVLAMAESLSGAHPTPQGSRGLQGRRKEGNGDAGDRSCRGPGATASTSNGHGESVR